MRPEPPESEPVPAGAAGAALDSTAVLIDRWRRGDEAARERLAARYLPLLTNWAHGRLPAYARGMADTSDLVQVTLLRALSRLGEFDVRREGALMAYLRRGLLNSIRDHIRRAAVRAAQPFEDEAHASTGRSPLEETLGRETLEAYERALAGLPEEQQEAVMLRIEFGYSWPQIADAIGRPSPNAARMLVARALARLAEDMHEHRS